MSNLLMYVTLAVAILEWISVANKWKTVEYITKPAVMVLLIAWMWTTAGPQGAMIWFMLGVALSLVGDVMLMLPHERFIAGLVAFLLAHVSYIIGFNAASMPLNPASLLLLLPVGVVAWLIYRRIAAGLKAKQAQNLQMPVLAYTFVISLMLFFALTTLTRGGWEVRDALLVSFGASFFFISDAVLAWNRFVSPIPRGRIINMMTYHLGQIMLIAGATLHLLG